MKKIIIDVDNHRHNGEIVPVGTTIDVNDQTADWMVAQGRAHYEAAAPINPAPKQVASNG